MKKYLLISCILILINTAVFSNGIKEEDTKYLSSTSWTAAFAYVGGLDDVISIAPADLNHPPEYEILPSDILKIQNCEAFIYAGYEVMMKTLSENTIDEEKTLHIKTGNTLENIKAQAFVISEKFNTQEKSMKRVKELEDLFISARIEIQNKQINDKKFYVHFHQVGFAKSLGLNIVGTFGPNGITSTNIDEIAKLDEVYIIDNVHNLLSDPLLEVNQKAKQIIWRNFPNKEEENALYNMLDNNIKNLLEEF